MQTQRTLVKSMPELWAELSESALLGRMLGEPFGEITITRRTPESSIEWESARAAGAIELEPSGFGTRVRLTAQIAPPAAGEPAMESPRRGVFARAWARLRSSEPRAEEPGTPSRPIDAGAAKDALTAVLDEIGTARHRPFSRHQ
ncbi:MAG TPA: hypothetical protein VKS25_12625 [Solirubrobacteraceae bacterium]|nr:hypothetical protein [Solirubrobacteraceae bacterium]